MVMAWNAAIFSLQKPSFNASTITLCNFLFFLGLVLLIFLQDSSLETSVILLYAISFSFLLWLCCVSYIVAIDLQHGLQYSLVECNLGGNFLYIFGQDCSLNELFILDGELEKFKKFIEVRTADLYIDD
jgi:hypothetical protein